MGGVKFFIDANVLISGMVFKGNEFRLLLNVMPGKSKHSCVTSEHVIDEITSRKNEWMILRKV